MDLILTNRVVGAVGAAAASDGRSMSWVEAEGFGSSAGVRGGDGERAEADVYGGGEG